MMEISFVAFIDILGFAEMVRSDCNDPKKRYKNLELLKNTLGKILDHAPTEIFATQFSDSIVLSSPFDKSKFDDFVEICIKVQQNLFMDGILCRGGIAVGRHYSENTFLFSEGLIEAYQLETTLARVPRIIISKDLMELIAYPAKRLITDNLITESDGETFIDYLKEIPYEQLCTKIAFFYASLANANSSVRDKLTWLLEYAAHHRPLPAELSINRFVKLKAI